MLTLALAMSTAVAAGNRPPQWHSRRPAPAPAAARARPVPGTVTCPAPPPPARPPERSFIAPVGDAADAGAGRRRSRTSRSSSATCATRSRRSTRPDRPEQAKGWKFFKMAEIRTEQRRALLRSCSIPRSRAWTTRLAQSSTPPFLTPPKSEVWTLTRGR